MADDERIGVLTMRKRISLDRRSIIIAALTVAALGVGGAMSQAALSEDEPASPAAVLDTTVPPVDDRPAYDWTAVPLADSVGVPELSAANDLLPFKAVLPAASSPTALYLANPVTTSKDQRQLVAVYKDPKLGLFQIFEQPVGMSQEGLEAWAKNCNTCSTQEVATLGDRRVLIVGSPGHGVSFSWLRGDVLQTVIGPNDTFTRESGLAVVSDMIAQGG